MQLQKVVNNLLSNAFKYTSDGGSISMELADGADECMFSVSDNGAGISEEDYVKIFERFYQAENIGQYGGTGIGLALSQGIVKAHQGDITVESQLGKGSCFKVTLKKGDAHFDSSVSRIERSRIRNIFIIRKIKNYWLRRYRRLKVRVGLLTASCWLLMIMKKSEISL